MAAYDPIADWYAEWEALAPAGDDVLDATVELLGDVTGMRVCDLACGQGRITRFLADRRCPDTYLRGCANATRGAEPRRL